MLAEPEGIESQFFSPLSHRQNFLVILLVRAADVGGIIAEHKNAELHINGSFV
jgi:hypothetical protein